VSVHKRTQQTRRRRQTRLTLFFFLTTGLFGFLVRFLRVLEGFGGVFHRLFGEFVAGKVILFAVMHGCGTVGVCCQFVKFSCSLMRIPRHPISFQIVTIDQTLRKLIRLKILRRSLAFSGIRLLLVDAPVFCKDSGDCPLAAESVQFGIQRFVGNSQPRQFLAKDAHAIANVNLQFDASTASAYEFKGIAG
jgi:hypothetical protein